MMMNLFKITLFSGLILLFITGCGRKIDFSFEEQTAMQGINIRGISDLERGSIPFGK